MAIYGAFADCVTTSLIATKEQAFKGRNNDVTRVRFGPRNAFVVAFNRGIPVDDTSRNKRVRTLVKKLNAQRKKQAAQIDILCNDFVAAQKDFLEALNRLSFTADVYESLLGAAEPDELFSIAAECIKARISDPNVAIFVRGCGSFELRMFESEPGDGLPDYPLESCFNAEAVNQVCTSNKICSLDELLEMGLQANPKAAEHLSAFAIPFGPCGASTGFILLYRSKQKPVTQGQLKYVAAITAGLASAIDSHRVHSTAKI